MLGIIFTLLGSTLAYFIWRGNITSINFTVTRFFECSGDMGGPITSNQLAPASCTNSTYAIQREVTVNPVINSPGMSIYMDLWLNVTQIDEGLANSENFKYALTSNPNSCTAGVISSGTFIDKDSVELFSSKPFTYQIGLTQRPDLSQTYYLYVWLDAAEEDTATQGNNFTLTLGGQCTQGEYKRPGIGTLSDVIRIEAESGSGNAAKYTGLDSDTYENDVYYFTGSATNTNVLFANHCWKMIRTTDTGGVKLLYNGTPTDGKCNNTGTASQLPSTKAFNSNVNSLAYVGYMYNKVYTYSSTTTIADDNIYGNSFTYSNGTYTLSGSTTTGAWSSIYNTLSNTHYTCLNNAGTCDTIKYIYYTNSSTMYYITLTGGKSVNDALNEMLWADDVNKTDSTIKDYIDTWYASNMTSYTSYLEDTVYCNDRSVDNLNGWNPNGGSTSSYLYFYAINKNDLTCTNKNDRFTMNSTIGNGKLTYPVGLMTVGEANLIGSTLRTTGNIYWLGSPGFFYNYAVGFAVDTSGGLYGNLVVNAVGARPVVSLKPGTEYVDGEGSGDAPFLVE